MNDLCSIELLRNAVARGLSADEEAAFAFRLSRPHPTTYNEIVWKRH
ncbi:MAG: hypothetical protein SH850_21550 [Planctomycetaceae bacterium]|nr:hypothetical protein [Planctomycetaceae bacterium]